MLTDNMRQLLIAKDREEILNKLLESILNIITKKILFTELEEIQELNIDTAENMQELVATLFERAIYEPKTCAQLCVKLLGSKFHDQRNRLRHSLIKNCQKEFKNYVIIDKSKVVDLDGNADTANYDEEKRQRRHRSLGIVHFISELYKIGILTSNIMLICVQSLLDQNSDVGLECLCKLLTAIGEQMEDIESTTPNIIRNFDRFFQQMNDLVQKENQNTKLSSHVRFMIQDVIDLRKNNWIPLGETEITTLLEEMQTLNIDTAEHIQGVVRRVFEGGIYEPEICAMLCSKLLGSKFHDERSRLTNSLIKNCEQVFKNYVIINKSKVVDLDGKADTANYDGEERKRRHRSLGIVQFIGEMYNVGILTSNRMLICVQSLLDQNSETNLECLCKLLTLIGKRMEDKRSTARDIIRNFDRFFQQMNDLVQKENQNTKLSSHVRFMIQDVIDLRKNNWIPRGETEIKTLLEEIQTLNIDTEENMQGFVRRVFERAIYEPEICAMLCSKLLSSNFENERDRFKEALVGNCEKELKNYVIIDKSKVVDLDGKADTANYDEGQRKGRHRSLGIVQFIGELYNVGILTSNRMLICVQSLLDQNSEANLEYLCKLLTLIGKRMEDKRSTTLDIILNFDRFFQQMIDLVQIENQNTKLSSHERLMLEDIIDLRKNNWIPWGETEITTLLEEMQTLNIDTADQMQELVGWVFERAIDEPEMCAQLCCKLLSIKFADERHRLMEALIRNCQKEFQNYVIVDKSTVDLVGKADTAKYDAEKRKRRHRSLGIVQFIGELYIVGILSSNIMLICMQSLLDQKSEADLECLCKLLTLVGKRMEDKRYTSKCRYSYFCLLFQQMSNLVETENGNTELSSHVRFMVQDVIDLRKNNWVPRSEPENTMRDGDNLNADGSINDSTGLVTSSESNKFINRSGFVSQLNFDFEEEGVPNIHFGED